VTEWREVMLGDVITLQRGFDLTQKQATPGPYQVISSSGPGFTTTVAKVEGPGVVTGRKGLLGKVHFSAGAYWPHDTTLWVKDFKGSEPRFVYYLLQTLPLASLDAGASNPTLNRNHAHLLPVCVPSPSMQAQIARVLGAIDDLIDNNRRRVEVLEEMARAIYREWFVHFRYPGHEDATFVDSPLGPIPEGWEIRPLGQVASLDRTSIQPSRSPEETFDHYSIPAFDGGQLPMADDGSMIKSGKFLVSDPAVMVSKLNPRIERTWLVEPESGRRSVASTEFLVLGPTTRLPLEWLYLLARSDIFQDRLRELSGGTSTSHQRAKPHDFLAIDVVAPAEELAADFGSAVEPQLRLARVLRTENRRLASIRDLLLPKLVTGQIDVSLLDLGALADQALGPAQESMCRSGTGWRPI